FKRLIDTPAVRAKLGIGVEKGALQLLADPKKVAKALLYVVNDLTSGKTKVADIYHQPQRAAYADKLPSDVAVKPSKGAPRTVVTANGKGAAKVKAQKAKP